MSIGQIVLFQLCFNFVPSFTTFINSSICACTGDQLTFECTAIGGDATIWHGSAFNCTRQNQPLNGIYLAHSRYVSGLVAKGNCSNGSILAASIGEVSAKHFVSQLNVIVSLDMHNKTIECDREEVNETRRVVLDVNKLLVATGPIL